MMNTADALTQQIDNARASAALVAQQDALRAEAESLPALERRQRAIAAREAARFNLNAVVQDAKAELDACRADAIHERGRLDFALAELHELQKSIPETASRIIAAGHKLQSAVNSCESAERALGSSLGHDAFSAKWEAVGGFDKALNATAGLDWVGEFDKLRDRGPSGYRPGLRSFVT